MSQDRFIELDRTVAILTMERDAMQRERDFWVNQARALQNHVQMWQTMYSGLLKEIAQGEVRPDVSGAVDLATKALAVPLTSVEAIRSLTAQMQPSTQGAYSVRGAGEREEVPGLIDRLKCMGNEAKVMRKPK